MTSRKLWALSGWIVAGILVVVLLVRSRSAPPVLTLGEARQDVVFEPLTITLTNTPIVLWNIANEYHTAPGWISASNNRIYAGLVDRVWSAEYHLPAPPKNTITVWAGGGFGASYTRAILDKYTLGGMVMYADGLRVFAGAGYRW